MTPAEGSDLEIGFVRPLGQGRVVWWSPIHRSSGFALDLCLFSTDLCRGPFSVGARTSCVLLWGSIGDQLAMNREYSFWVKLVGVMWRVAVSSWAWRSVVSVGAIRQLAWNVLMLST